MGSGCLSPPTPIFQLSISLIDNIYQDIKQQNLATPHSEPECLKNYTLIKQKIAKKGQLKKLCDHLSSHRSKVYQTVLHTYRVTQQSKSHNYKYVCIIILDAILNSVPALKLNTIMNNESKIMTVRSAYFPTLNKLTLINNSQRQMVLSTKNPVQNNESEPAVSTPGYQITSNKFQGVYLTTILLLVKQDGLLYKLSLQNLIKYCQFSNTPLNNQAQVIQIINNISYHIQANSYLQVSLKCYMIILFRMRQTYFAQNIQNTEVFFDLWLANDQPSSLQVSRQQKQITRSKISQFCMNIIKMFIISCIEGFHYTLIIQAIFKALDKSKFDNHNVTKIQNLIFDSTSQLQLKNQFNKSLIIYLMGYTGFPPVQVQETVISILRLHSKIEQNQNQQDYNNKSPLQKKWAECYNLGNPEQFSKRYKNIQQRKNKLNAMPRISKWVFQYKFVEVNELLSYSGINLFYAYVFNLYSEQNIIKEKSILQFKSIFDKLTSKQQRIQLLDVIFSQLEESQALDQRIRYTLLVLCQTVLQREKQVPIPNNSSYFIQLLDTSQCFQVNNKILELGGSLLSKINRQMVKAHLQRICKFYIYFYFQILNGFSNISQKLTLVQRFYSLHSKFPAFYKGIYIAFIQRLMRDMQKHLVPENSLFFLDYIVSKFSQKLNLGIRDLNLQAYLKKIKQKKDFQQLSIVQQYSSDRIPIDIDIPEKEKQQLQFYSESQQFFKKNQKKQNQITGTASVFWKPGQSLIKTQSRDSVDTKGDLDLQNILDIIRN